MPAAQQFTPGPMLLSIAAGTFAPPDGAPRPYAATSIRQWCDVALAAACFAEARRMATDAAAIAALDAGPPSHQAQYVFKTLSWLANGYNALGIDWYNDPAARALYRRAIAGAPLGNTVDDQERSQFDQAEPYRLGWYDAAYPWPLVPNAQDQAQDASVGNSPLAGLPLQAHQQFARYGGANAQNPMQWVQLCGLYIDTTSRDVADPREIEGGVAYAAETRNRAFTWLPYTAGSWETQSAAAALWTDTHEEDPSLRYEDESVVKRRFLAAVMFGGFAYGDLPPPPTGVHVNRAGVRVARGMADWNTFVFDEQQSIVRVPLKASNPLKDYLGWIADWAAACVARAPADIVTASRLYVLWQNGQTVDKNPNVLSAVSSIAGELTRDRETPDRTADLVFNSSAAVAPAFAAIAPPYGALIALGIVAIAAAGRIINAAIEHGISAQRKRDDLGLFKPALARGQIGGSLREGGGAPPAVQIPAPAGWTRPRVLGVIFLPGGGAFNAAPVVLEGGALLARMQLTGPAWDALAPDAQAAALARAGLNDPAAQLAARDEIGYYLRPATRPKPPTPPGSTGKLLLLGALAAASIGGAVFALRRAVARGGAKARANPARRRRRRSRRSPTG